MQLSDTKWEMCCKKCHFFFLKEMNCWPHTGHFFLRSTRNTPTPMTCSWGERRSCLELRESMILSCWLKGPSITRLVRQCRRISVNGVLSGYLSPSVGVQVELQLWEFTRFKAMSRFTELNLSLFSPLLDLEKIKAYIDSFRFGAPPHGGGGIGK